MKWAKGPEEHRSTEEDAVEVENERDGFARTCAKMGSEAMVFFDRHSQSYPMGLA